MKKIGRKQLSALFAEMAKDHTAKDRCEYIENLYISHVGGMDYATIDQLEQLEGNIPDDLLIIATGHGRKTSNDDVMDLLLNCNILSTDVDLIKADDEYWWIIGF